MIDNLLWKDRSDAWESFGHKDRESLILPLTETPKSYFILEQIRQLYFCPKWPHAVSLVKSLYLWKQLFHRTVGVPRFNVTSMLGALVGTVTNGWWWVWTLYKGWHAKENNSEAATLGRPFASPGSFQTSSLRYQSQLLERLRACGAQASPSRARSVWGSPFASPCPISSASGTSATGAWRLSSAFLYGRPAFCPLSSPPSLLLPFQQAAGNNLTAHQGPLPTQAHKETKSSEAGPTQPQFKSLLGPSWPWGPGEAPHLLWNRGQWRGPDAQRHWGDRGAKAFCRLGRGWWGQAQDESCVSTGGKKAQDESCELGFIWGKMRTR